MLGSREAETRCNTIYCDTGSVSFLFVNWEGEKMSCSLWKCVKQNDDKICDELDTECIGYMCEDYRRCDTCNKQDSEDCPQY